MGQVTITGAMIIIIGWVTLIEFDSYSESKRTQILQTIKGSPVYILLIALMPNGILINVVGSFLDSVWHAIVGASLIFLQRLVISLLFWKHQRWKSILILVDIGVLDIFIYISLLYSYV